MIYIDILELGTYWSNYGIHFNLGIPNIVVTPPVLHKKGTWVDYTGGEDLNHPVYEPIIEPTPVYIVLQDKWTDYTGVDFNHPINQLILTPIARFTILQDKWVEYNGVDLNHPDNTPIPESVASYKIINDKWSINEI